MHRTPAHVHCPCRWHPVAAGLALFLSAAPARTVSEPAPSGNGLSGRTLVQIPLGRTDLPARLAALGPHRVEIRSQLTMRRGAQEYAQEDTYLLLLDANGNSQVLLTTPTSQLEVTRLGEDLFVRFDRGHLRRKTRRDMDAQRPPQQVLQALAQCLQPFGRAMLGPAEPTRVGNRDANRYPLQLPPEAAAGTPLENPPTLAASTASTTPVVAGWRALARPQELSGAITLDAASGLPLAAEIDGRLEVADRPQEPTQMHLSCSLKVSELGRQPTLKMPRAIPEYRRAARDRDPLGFFRDQLPPAAPAPPPARP